jgi:hypothetical protein
VLNDGEFIVNGWAIQDTFTFNGGNVGGVGHIVGDVTCNDCTMGPGNSPGELEIFGELFLGAGSVLQLELGDLLTVSEFVTAEPGAIIELLLGSAVPSVPIELTDFFDVAGSLDIAAAQVFAVVDDPAAASVPLVTLAGTQVTTTVTGSSQATPVAAPASGLLAGLGLVLAGLARGRKDRA